MRLVVKSDIDYARKFMLIRNSTLVELPDVRILSMCFMIDTKWHEISLCGPLIS